MSKDGETPLDFAISRHNQKSVIDYLVSCGGKKGIDVIKEKGSLAEKISSAEKHVVKSDTKSIAKDTGGLQI